MVCYEPLKSKINNWKKITNDQIILDWIEGGVKLNFSSTPAPFELENRQFSKEEYSFVKKEVSDLLSKGCVRKVSKRPTCVSPLSVAPKKGPKKFRLVHDLRLINERSVAPALVYEDITTVSDICEPNDNLTTLDIKDGYHHLSIHESYRTFLGFKFEDTYYEFCVLPFGLNLSCYAFIKTTRAVVTYIRKNNIRCVSYVDDFIVISGKGRIDVDTRFVVGLFRQLGLTINLEKSNLTPSTRQTFIGYIIDTGKSECAIWIEIPKIRIRNTKHNIGRAIKKGVVNAKGLAKIAGQLVSMTKAVIPAKLMLRNVYRLIATRGSWADTLYLDRGTTADLKWWYANLQAWNGKFIPKVEADCVQLATDASSYAWGGLLVASGQQAQGSWEPVMAHRSSNFREMTAVLMSLKSFLSRLKNQKVQILTDNITTCAFINFQGGQSPQLDAVAREIWWLVMNNNIQISAKHIRGKDNVIPDALSRLDSPYNWRCHPGLFNYLDCIWGPHEVDRFACRRSTQLPRYNSLYLDTHTHGVDALAQTDWGVFNNWVNPPFRMIPKILKVIKSQQAEATLIAPMWESKYYHRELVRMSVSPPIKLPPARLFCLPLGKMIPEPMKNPKWKIYAWRLSGKANFHR